MNLLNLNNLTFSNIILALMSDEVLVAIGFALLVIIAFSLFRYNYRAQMIVQFYMNDECDIYSKRGLEKYLHRNKRKLKDPSLVIVKIENLGYIYNSTFQDKEEMMYIISNCMLKGLGRLETVARISFDTFIILVDGKSKDEIREYCKDLDERMQSIYFESFGSYFFNLKFGVYEKTPLKDIKKTLLYALSILDYSKYKEGNIYFYSDDVEKGIAKTELINNLKAEALELKQFVPFIQPKVNFKTGQVVGGEVLVRWLDGNGNVLFFPNEFIPLFEKNGFIKNIDFEMFEQTCIYLQTLIRKGYRDVVLSLNISKINFESKTFLDEITKIVTKYNVPTANIEFEITETISMINPQYISHCIMKLRNLGYKVAMDDFGKEYSSLGNLVSNPFDTIKLDMVFFENSLNTSKEKVITENIINLLNNINTEIVCEGVRDKQTLEILSQMTRDVIIQGYSISKPIPLNQFEAILNTDYTTYFPEIIEEEEEEELPPARDVYSNVSELGVVPVSEKDNEELNEIKERLDNLSTLFEKSFEKEKADSQKSELDQLKAEIEKLNSSKSVNSSSNDALLNAILLQMTNMNNQNHSNTSNDDKIMMLINEINELKNKSKMDALMNEIEELKNKNKDLARQNSDYQERSQFTNTQTGENRVNRPNPTRNFGGNNQKENTHIDDDSKNLVNDNVNSEESLVPAEVKTSKLLVDKAKEASVEQKYIYNLLKNDIMKYMFIQCKPSKSYDKFYTGKECLAKLNITKKSIRIYLALNPSDYPIDQFPRKDVGDIKAHKDTPLCLIVRSQTSIRKCEQLINDLMKQKGIKINRSYKKTNYV